MPASRFAALRAALSGHGGRSGDAGTGVTGAKRSGTESLLRGSALPAAQGSGTPDCTLLSQPLRATGCGRRGLSGLPLVLSRASGRLSEADLRTPGADQRGPAVRVPATGVWDRGRSGGRPTAGAGGG